MAGNAKPQSSGTDSFQRELQIYVRSKHPIIAIESFEEGRVVAAIKEYAEKDHRTVYTWSSASGFKNGIKRTVDENWAQRNTDPNSNENDDENTPSEMVGALEMIRKKVVDDHILSGKDVSTKTKGNIFVMFDPHPYVNQNPLIQRKLRDLVPVLKGQKKIIVLISPEVKIPQDLQKDISVLDVPLPDENELENVLCTALSGLTQQEEQKKKEMQDSPEKRDELKNNLKRLQDKNGRIRDQISKSKNEIISAAKGLTINEAENVFAKCIIQGSFDIKKIIAEKKQIIKKSGLLEYIEPKETVDSIGGLRNLKKYAMSTSRRFSKDAREYGIDPPRGIITVGVPGAGKSLTAKACGNILQLPLLRLDMAQLVSKYYGESSNNMRNVWKLAKALAPCILWVDEIEKALGAGQNGEMHEESARLFGSFLTEMEESNGVFVFATCNDHKALKAELLSRFPKIFFVNAPTTKERVEIFQIQLKAVKRDPAKFDLNILAANTKGFVGREIRNIIQDALGNAFDRNEELNTAHIVETAKTIRPITIQKAELLKEMIRWAGDNAMPASDDLEQEKPVQGQTVTQDRISALDNEDDDPLNAM